MDGASVNQFQGGLDKDILKSILPKNKYTDARNVRLVTDKGQSTGALENVIGNTLAKQIPNTYQVYKITVGTTGTGGTTITINGNTSASLSVTTSTTAAQIYAIIIAITGYGSTFSAAYSGTYVLVWGLTANPVISTSNGDLVSTLYIAAQSTLDLLGWTTLRDNIILFTTNDSSSGGGVGQIWKVTYDKQAVFNSPSTSFTFTLLYNNNVNFTKQHPICRWGQTEGRYENAITQRIYWTDNFNSPRVFNIADSQGFALDPTLLSTNPTFSMSVPILNKINDTGGVLPIGNYQLSYRLKNTGGGTTAFMPASNQVKLIGTLSTAAFRDQFGTNAGSISSKSITWSISGIDTDFDRIEIVALYWEDHTDLVPEIDIIYDEPIPNSGTLSITYTGNEDKVPITLDEFVSPTIVFSKCKTITSKDNRLFYGNVSNTRFDVTFDARSLRFSNAGPPVARIQNSDGTGVTDVDTTFSNLPAEGTNDGINPSQAPTTGTYRFQSDGITIGGSGPNIDYTFEAFSNGGSMYGDVQNIATPYGALGGAVSSTTPMGQNFRFTNPQPGSYTVNGQTYPGNNFYTPAISPYLESLYKGYQHEETYRFGIVFFDKAGNASPVHWIGDITCPAVFDVDGSTGAVNYGISAMTGNNQYVKILHPIFTVKTGNLSAADQARVGGFSIVRCSRTEDDKTVVYSGLISPIEYDGVSLNYLPTISTGINDSLYGNLGNAETTSGRGGAATNNRALCMFYPPDYLLGSYRGLKSGDSLVLTSILDAPSANFKAAGTTLDFFTEKVYTQSSITRQLFTIDGATEVTKGQQGVVLNGNTFNNNSWDGADCYSVGEKGILLHTSTGAGFDYTALPKANSGKFYCHYKTTVTNQYGGNSYTQRSLNEYVSCDHFQVLTPTTFTTYTVSLFGGDTLTTIYDTQRYIKNWISLGGGTPTKCSYFNFFPCEMQHNTEWKAGITINRVGLYDSGTSDNADLGEAFDLGSSYVTIDNKFQKYFPLPAVFNATDEFDNRFYWSEIKINGETQDSWGIVKTNNYWDVEGIYGPINNSDVFQDKILFWQDRSFGWLMVNPVSTTQDISGTAIVLGTGNVIQRHNYISTEAGAKHQWGMAKSDKSYCFYDIIKKRMWRFSGEGLVPLSDVKGLESYFYNNTNGVLFTNDNPVYINPSYGATGNIIGINATYDYRFNTFYFTFKDYKTRTLNGSDTNVFNQFTISYNELLGCFDSFHDVYPSMYINDGLIILTRDQANVNNLYMHNVGNYGSYYGTTYDSTVQFVINENPLKTKVFDNLLLTTESINRANYNSINQAVNTWTSIRCFDDYQNTDYQTLTNNTNIKRKERTWQLAIPRNRVLYTSSSSPDIFVDLSVTDKSYGERMRDKYLFVDLKLDNTTNYNLITHNVICLYRISDR